MPVTYICSDYVPLFITVGNTGVSGGVTVGDGAGVTVGDGAGATVVGPVTTAAAGRCR